MNIEEFYINGENMLNLHLSSNDFTGIKYSVPELINIVKKRKTPDNKDVKNFKIIYTVPNTAYTHASRYEYEIHRFDDLKDFINKYLRIN